MGWGRMFLLGNWGQQMDIEEQREEIEDLRQQMQNVEVRDTSNLQARIAQLELESSELRLYLAALVRYMGHKGVLVEDEFRTLVETIDKEDGNTDQGYRGRILS